MIPVISLAMLLPALGAIAVSVARDPDRARTIARAIGIAALAASIAITIHVAITGPLDELGPLLPIVHARWHLRIDAIAAPFLPLAALITTAILIAAPRESMDRRACSAMLLTLAAMIGVYAAADLLVLSACWIASLVPGAHQMHGARSPEVRRRIARTYDIFLVLGALPIVAATLVVGWIRTRAGAFHPFEIVGAPLAPGEQRLVLVLFAIALTIRKAVLPFHSWLPVLVERGPIGIAAIRAGTHLGAFLVLRAIVPLTPEAARTSLPILANVALVSALYAAFVALGQSHLKRALGFVITSQLALVLVGLAQLDAASMHGALLQTIALGLSATGLLLLAAALESRAGTLELARLGGLSLRFPQMAVAFLVLGLGAIALPGTLGYVAEDLLLHGLLDGHPLVAGLLLLTTVLNGITILRLFFQVFLGPAREPRLIGAASTDLRPRESAMVLGLAAATFLLGIAPGPLLAMREASVEDLALLRDSRDTERPHGSTHAPGRVDSE